MFRSACTQLTLLAALPVFLLPAGSASAAELYFNSYGWHDVYRMDTATSQVALLLPEDISDTHFFSSADFAGDGRLYGIGPESSLVAVDVSGPLAVWTEQCEIADDAKYLSFAPDDGLWVTSGSTLRQVAPGGATVPGTLVDVTYSGSGLSFWGIDFAADGTLYAIDSEHLYDVDPLTGVATRIHSRPNLDGGIFTEIDVAADGMVRMLGSFDYLYEYNPQTDTGGWRPGKLLYEGYGFSPSSLASPVPEPSTLALLAACAFLLLAAAPRRRR
jgi:outer membrane protein assembly factor BamB